MPPDQSASEFCQELPKLQMFLPFSQQNQQLDWQALQHRKIAGLRNMGLCSICTALSSEAAGFDANPTVGHNLGTESAKNQPKPCNATQEKARRINYLLDFGQTLDLAILVRVQAPEPIFLFP